MAVLVVVAAISGGCLLAYAYAFEIRWWIFPDANIALDVLVVWPLIALAVIEVSRAATRRWAWPGRPRCYGGHPMPPAARYCTRCGGRESRL